jgi:uncharacterized membrane protein YeaQ/YmgE (transglycosylase-associated protein family)
MPHVGRIGQAYRGVSVDSYAPAHISNSISGDTEFIRELREGNMSVESLLIILVIGVIAGWLAGQIVQGTGFGIVGDLIIGILGAFIGSWLLPQLGIHLGAGIIAAIVNATIGAVILLLIIKLIRGGGGWRGSWR